MIEAMKHDGKARKRPRASKSHDAEWDEDEQRDVHRRPKGRAPKEKTWDKYNGRWVPEQGENRLPAGDGHEEEAPRESDSGGAAAGPSTVEVTQSASAGIAAGKRPAAREAAEKQPASADTATGTKRTREQKEWTCSHCTLINKSVAVVCDACGNPPLTSASASNRGVNHRGDSESDSGVPQEDSAPAKTARKDNPRQDAGNDASREDMEAVAAAEAEAGEGAWEGEAEAEEEKKKAVASAQAVVEKAAAVAAAKAA